MQNKFNRSNCLSHMISSAMWIRKSLLKQNNYGKVSWIYFNYLSRWSFIFLLGWNKYCVLPTAIVCSFMRKLLHQPNQYSTYCSDSMVLFADPSTSNEMYWMIKDCGGISEIIWMRLLCVLLILIMLFHFVG